MNRWTEAVDMIIIELPPCPNCGGPLDHHSDGGNGVSVSCYKCYIDYPNVEAR